MTTLNRRKAKAAGYRALTSRYRLPREQWMLDGVLADMRRARVDHVVVKDGLGVSVWRGAPLRGPLLPARKRKGERADGPAVRPYQRRTARRAGPFRRVA